MSPDQSPDQSSHPANMARRPLETRKAAWPRRLASRLITFGLTPNQVSVLSICFAALSAAAFAGTIARQGASQAFFFVLAATGIQLRLLCNLLDGLMAVEGGMRTKAGDLYNDLPDRISDSLILIAAGYAVPPNVWGMVLSGPLLGWAAALLAALTAYIRLLGAAAGTTQYFIGPMAKQQRMGLLTAACLLAAAEPWFMVRYHTGAKVLAVAMLLIVVGSVITCIRRLARITADLKSS